MQLKHSRLPLMYRLGPVARLRRIDLTMDTMKPLLEGGTTGGSGAPGQEADMR